MKEKNIKKIYLRLQKKNKAKQEQKAINPYLKILVIPILIK